MILKMPAKIGINYLISGSIFKYHGFQVCPQLLQRLTVLLLPKNPIQKEYPL